MTESNSMRTKDELGFRWRGRIGVLVLVPLALVTIFSRPLVLEDSALDLGLDVIAYGAFIAGAVLRFWSTLYVGGRKEKTLVVEGPYSICRNPLYVGSFLLALSIGLFLKSVTFALGLALVSAFYIGVTVPTEEEHLRRQMGKEYEDYCRKVPRYWPRFSLARSREELTISLKALRREWKRALLGWLWLPVVSEAVSHLRCESWWPHPFGLW